MGKKKEIEVNNTELEVQNTFNTDSFVELNDNEEVIIENIEECEVEEDGN